ncbi:hypothetical protein LMG18897_0275 [Bifidobacterium adolescentis]|uniref:hypothetical protein n=1 Tax=Bifidobacterium adolescentis TaxID=1680 RepID=UPI000A19AB4D|nr:hypothetical protein [Bifidobacterium adolescentis]OSH06175.1 hypothetical protein LMG18897_0275 [Bifidobacterium adolescentis]
MVDIIQSTAIAALGAAVIILTATLKYAFDVLRTSLDASNEQNRAIDGLTRRINRMCAYLARMEQEETHDEKDR